MTGRVAAPLPWLAGLLAIYLAAPLAAGIGQVWFADWRTVDIAALGRAGAISLASATAATAIIALGGIPLGYLLARLPRRATAIIGFVVQLPLALPPLTSGILLLFVIGYDGWLGHGFGAALTDSFVGIVLAEVFVAAPFLIIAARSAFAAIDVGLEGVAATLGRGPLETFFRISLPIARPAIAAGLLLSWLRAFGEFGATVMVAYHPYSLPVYTYVAFGAQGLPAMLPILLPTLVLAGLALVLSQTLARRPRRAAGRAIAATGLWRLPLAALGSPRAPPVAMADRPGLRLHLSKRLGDFRLALDWAPRSRRLAILGPSGSGKSLTLRLIAGLEPAERAEVWVAGEELTGLAAAARGVGYVPQNYGLFPHLTAAAQLGFARDADPATARRWIERLGLAGLEQRYPAELSLGQQQRVALARALVRPARLLLLDEPFSALDAPLRARLRSELRDLQREIGATTILVTHDPDEAALLADELLVLADGRVLQSGPTAEVFARPAGEIVAGLLGTENPAEGVAIGEHRIAIGAGVVLDTAGPPLPLNYRVGWAIAPNGVRICGNGRYRGRIAGVVPLGHGCRIELRLGDAVITCWQSRPDWTADAWNGAPRTGASGTGASGTGTGASGTDENGGDSPWSGASGTDGQPTDGQPCRLDIDPYAIRVWPR
ncbi:MAG TPA: ATP-binding cassette domain-containing protein [Stellaceae bacterium]|nr:ATP-binding cassette domain-containing protein [Stellaceae bacterium]